MRPVIHPRLWLRRQAGERQSSEHPISQRRFDPYRPLSRSERSGQQARILDVLRRRSGNLHFAQRTLSKREAFFGALKTPYTWTGSLDREGLQAALNRKAPAPEEPRALWLYVAAIASESETYGVELEIRRRSRAGVEKSSEDQLYLILEESYHGRILDALCHTCGVSAPAPYPPWSMRWMIRLFEFLPDPVRYVGILSGELLGCVVFEMLADHTDLFSDQPEVVVQLHSLISEIVRDERWHVLLCRAQLGPLRIRLARWLAPLVVWMLTREIPELTTLGCSRANLLERMYRGLTAPPELDWVEPPAGLG